MSAVLFFAESAEPFALFFSACTVFWVRAGLRRSLVVLAVFLGFISGQTLFDNFLFVSVFVETNDLIRRIFRCHHISNGWINLWI